MQENVEKEYAQSSGVNHNNIIVNHNNIISAMHEIFEKALKEQENDK